MSGEAKCRLMNMLIPAKMAPDQPQVNGRGFQDATSCKLNL